MDTARSNTDNNNISNSDVQEEIKRLISLCIANTLGEEYGWSNEEKDKVSMIVLGILGEREHTDDIEDIDNTPDYESNDEYLSRVKKGE